MIESNELVPPGGGSLTQSGGQSWFGGWPGQVVSVADPEKRGRVRVRVTQAYGSLVEDEFIADENLPWALPSKMTHNKSGEAWVPPIGTWVWVSFYGGDHETPIYSGGWATEADAITEFVSSYLPGGGPTTRVIKTENEHIFEMRWREGQEKIRLKTAIGNVITLYDSSAEGGPKIVVQTPAGFEMTLDELLGIAQMKTPAGFEMTLNGTVGSAHIKTPTQTVELLESASTINITSPGIINVASGGAVNVTAAGAATVTAGGAATVASTGAMAISGSGMAISSSGGAPTTMTGGGTLTSSFTGAAIYTFVGLLTYVVGGLYALGAAGITMTSAAIILVTTGGPVIIGTLAGAKQAVVLASFIAKYNAHIHDDSLVAPTTPPLPPNLATAADLSSNVTVD